MKSQLSNIPSLRKILWIDAILGGVTAFAGLSMYRLTRHFLGLPTNVILFIAAVTLAYALMALTLALQYRPSALSLKVLTYANWAWTVISIILLISYFGTATVFGITFLILQVIVVGTLAYLEGKHVK